MSGFFIFIFAARKRLGAASGLVCQEPLVGGWRRGWMWMFLLGAVCGWGSFDGFYWLVSLRVLPRWDLVVVIALWTVAGFLLGRGLRRWPGLVAGFSLMVLGQAGPEVPWLGAEPRVMAPWGEACPPGEAREGLGIVRQEKRHRRLLKKRARNLRLLGPSLQT